MDRAREHFLAGAGFAGEEHADVGGRDAPGNREELGHLFGDPEAAVGLEGVGGPERRALLLFAPIAVEGDGGVDQLADGDAGASVVEGRASESATIIPGLVAMDAAGDGEAVAGLGRRGQGLRIGPSVRGDAAGPSGPPCDERHRVGGAAQFQECVRLASKDVGVARKFDQNRRIVQTSAYRGTRQNRQLF